MIFGNCFLEIDHECYQAQSSLVALDAQFDFFPCTSIDTNEYCNIYVHSSNSIGTILVANDI